MFFYLVKIIKVWGIPILNHLLDLNLCANMITIISLFTVNMPVYLFFGVFLAGEEHGELKYQVKSDFLHCWVHIICCYLSNSSTILPLFLITFSFFFWEYLKINIKHILNFIIDLTLSFPNKKQTTTNNNLHAVKSYFCIIYLFICLFETLSLIYRKWE